MRVRDLMSRQVVTIEESDSCLEAVSRMHRASARHLPVVSREGRLVGIVTDRDLRHYLLRPEVFEQQVGTISVDVLLKAVPVSEIMSSPVVRAEPDDEVVAVAHRMKEDRVGGMPVVQGGRVIGMLTETDLLRQICRADAACAPGVAEIVVSYP